MSNPYAPFRQLFILCTTIALCLFGAGTVMTVKADESEMSGTESVDSESESGGSETEETQTEETQTQEPVELTKNNIRLSKTVYTYNGSKRKPTVTVTVDSQILKKGTHYTLSYSKNTNAGTAAAIVTGIGDYSGTVRYTFTIKPMNLSKLTAALSSSSFVYNGGAKKPSVTLTNNGTSLKASTDYTVSYTDNINAGTASLTVTGKGNYTGTLKKSYTIAPRSISSFSAKLSKTAYSYNGKNRTPSAAVSKAGTRLKANRDFTISYKNNINAGTASAIITAKGNYTGTLTRTYKIARASISKYKLSLSKKLYTYNGSRKTPSATVKLGSKTLKLNKDYTISYRNNTNAGTATAVINAIGNYTGTLSHTFKIKAADLSKYSAKLSKKSLVYNGKTRTPSATVSRKSQTLKKNRDYRISYSNNKLPGIATITIKGTGNYSGRLTKTFRILPKRANLYNIEHDGQKLVLTWEADSLVSGYEVLRRAAGGAWSVLGTVSDKSGSYTDSSTGNYGNQYKYRIRAYVQSKGKTLYGSYSKTLSAKVQHGAVTIKSVMPLSSSSFVVKWAKQDNVSGYYILRRKNNATSWTKVKTLTSGGKTSYTDTGLTYGSTYTYAVQAYTTSGGKTVKGVLDENGFTAKLSYSSRYKDGCKLYYDAAGNLITDVDKIIGKQSSYQIKVNKQANVVTVYARDGSNGYTIPVKVFLCSAGGSNTPVGTFYTPEKYRWHTLNHGVEGQWCTRIHGGVLFHSVWYYSRSKTDLTTVQYNRLGNTASAGCVRLNCESAKWIYDNCSLGTSVTIYESSDPGPLGKPEALIIPSWHTWDPTDPTCADLCAEHGCH